MAQAEKMVHGCQHSDEFSGSIQKAQLNPVCATQPWELVHIDFTTIEIDMDPKTESPRTKTILVLTDHFTQFAQAYVVLNQKAVTVARCLHETVFPVFAKRLSPWIQGRVHACWVKNSVSRSVT